MDTDTPLDQMLELATKEISSNDPLHGFAKQALRLRRRAAHLGRRQPAPMAWLPQLDDIAEALGGFNYNRT